MALPSRVRGCGSEADRSGALAGSRDMCPGRDHSPAFRNPGSCAGRSPCRSYPGARCGPAAVPTLRSCGASSTRLRRDGGAVPGLPATETIQRVSSRRHILATPPREQLYAIQTPQCFHAAILRSSLERASKAGYEGTDESSVVRWAGHRVVVVPGCPGQHQDHSSAGSWHRRDPSFRRRTPGPGQ